MLNKNNTISSMTGFAHVRSQFFELTLKSVNSRVLDINIKIPKELLFLEPELIALVSPIISRGRVELYIMCDEKLKALSSELIFNEALALKLLADLQKFSQKSALIKPEINLGQLLTTESLVEKKLVALPENIKKQILEAAKQALIELKESRLFEGRKLALILEASLKRCLSLIELIKARADQDIQKRFQMLTTRINKIFSEFNLDNNRLLQECALLAERSDFTEEIDRLIAHSEHFVKICDDKAPCGRRLDFLCQEMLRESNTLLTKAFEHAVMALAIELKAEIERLREQVQNIE